MTVCSPLSGLLFAVLVLRAAVLLSGQMNESIILTQVQTSISGKRFHAVAIPGSPNDINENRTLLSHAKLFTFTDINVRFFSSDIDYSLRYLYLYDYYTASIVKVENFDWGTNFVRLTKSVLHAGVSRSYVTVAVDWVSHNVYWTDPLYRWIAMQSGGTTYMNQSQYKTVIEEDLERPTALAVDPIHGFLFWSDIGKTVTIGRSSLTGTNRTTLISTGLATPYGIDVDLATSSIFWVDGIRNTIETANFDGKDRKVLRRVAHRTFFDIAVYKDTLNVVDISEGKLMVFHKDTGDYLGLMLQMNGSKFVSVTMYSPSTQPKQTDVCSQSSCSDLCVSRNGEAECLCKDGYKLDSNGITCSETKRRFNRALLLTNSSSICLFDINILTSRTNNSIGYACFFSSDEDIAFIDIDMAERKIVYASSRSIYFVNIASNAIRDRLMTTPLAITGLGLDWTHNSVYWCMGEVNGRIKVLYRQTLTALTLLVVQYPRDLILLPLSRMMVWISGSSSTYKIESATMTGSDRYTVVSSEHMSQPTALAIDSSNDDIYWSDKGNIKRCSFDGSNIVTIGEEHIKSAGQLLIYKNHLIVTEEMVSKINVLDKSKPTSIKQTVITSIIGIVKHMKVLDSSLQPQYHLKGPCRTLNGGCEQICIPEGNNRLCKCDYGFRLDPNKETCSSAPLFDNFLLVTDWTHDKIYQVSLDHNDDVRAVDTDIPGSPTAIAYNYVTKQVIWGASTEKHICSVRLNETGVSVMSNTGIYGSHPDRFAIDFTSGNIFYTLVRTTLFGFNGVGVLSPNGAHRKLIADVGMPRDIVVDPAEGLLFWTNHQADTPYVKRANMDGSSVTTIITSNITWPNGLAIDYTDKRLYLADGARNTIQRCMYTGDCDVIYTDTAAHLVDIDLLGDFLYYTAWNRQYITKIHKLNVTNKSELASRAELGRLDALTAYSSTGSWQPKSTACIARAGLGVCSTFCLPTLASYTCACEDGVSLRADERTCDNVMLPTVASTTTTSSPSTTTSSIYTSATKTSPSSTTDSSINISTTKMSSSTTTSSIFTSTTITSPPSTTVSSFHTLPSTSKVTTTANILKSLQTGNGAHISTNTHSTTGLDTVVHIAPTAITSKPIITTTANILKSLPTGNGAHISTNTHSTTDLDTVVPIAQSAITSKPVITTAANILKSLPTGNGAHISTNTHSTIGLDTVVSIAQSAITSKTAITTTANILKTLPTGNGAHISTNTHSTIGLDTVVPIAQSAITSKTAITTTANILKTLPTGNGAHISTNTHSTIGLDTVVPIAQSAITSKTAITTTANILKTLPTGNGAHISTNTHSTTDLDTVVPIAQSAITSKPVITTTANILKSLPTGNGAYISTNTHSTIGLDTVVPIAQTAITSKTAITTTANILKSLQTGNGAHISTNTHSTTGVNTVVPIAPTAITSKTAISTEHITFSTVTESSTRHSSTSTTNITYSSTKHSRNVTFMPTSSEITNLSEKHNPTPYYPPQSTDSITSTTVTTQATPRPTNPFLTTTNSASSNPIVTSSGSSHSTIRSRSVQNSSTDHSLATSANVTKDSFPIAWNKTYVTTELHPINTEQDDTQNIVTPVVATSGAVVVAVFLLIIIIIALKRSKNNTLYEPVSVSFNNPYYSDICLVEFRRDATNSMYTKEEHLQYAGDLSPLCPTASSNSDTDGYEAVTTSTFKPQ